MKVDSEDRTQLKTPSEIHLPLPGSRNLLENNFLFFVCDNAETKMRCC